MASASFIQENAKRRNAINRTRVETGLAPPREPAAAPQQTDSAPEPKVAPREANGPNRQSELEQVKQTINTVRGAMQQRILSSASLRPAESSQAGMKRAADRWARLFRPVWR